MVKPVDLSLIIVNYNVRGFLENLLRSIEQASDSLTLEIFVVDNHSTDGSVEMIRHRFPRVHLIENRENRGFAAANNQALRLYTGRYTCLINPDVLIQENTLRVMTDFMDAHPDVGAAGCRVLNPDGSLQLACRRSIPTPMSAFFKLTGLSRLFPGNRIIGAYNMTYLDPDAVQDVDAVSGSFMMVRRETVRQVGFLDEAFFMYGEDLDWFYRIRRAGWRVCYTPRTEIVHYKGESARRSRIRPSIEFYRAMYIFARKHRPTCGARFIAGLIHALITAGILVKGVSSISFDATRRILIPLIDLATVNITPLIATIIRVGELTPLNRETMTSYLFVHGACSLINMSCFYLFGLYRRPRPAPWAAGMAVTSGFVVISALTYFTPDFAFSRTVTLLAFFMNLIIISGWRSLASRLIASPRRVIILGTDDYARRIHLNIQETLYRNYEVVGFMDSDPEVIGSSVHGLDVLNGNGVLSDTLDKHRIDEVIIASRTLAYQDILRLVSTCARLGTGLRMISLPDRDDGTRSEKVDTVTLVEGDQRPMVSVQRFVRRMIRA